VAIGNFANASGLGATAFGSNTTASGTNGPTALGYQTSATNSFATAMGGNTTASGNGATALGQLSVASGNGSVAMGYSTTASNAFAIAGGFQATASGGSSVALGHATSASGTGSVALGQSTTASGDNTTALGRDASTNAQGGSFVWGDASGTTTLSALAPNEFSLRASGGVRLRTSPDLSTGCDLAAAGGVWNCTSSRTQKTDFAEVAADDILDRLRSLPIQTWRYKAEDPDIRHLGPYAEDFRAAFRLGADSLTIGHIDLGGVSLAAAKALEARTRDLRNALSAKHEEIAALQSQLAEMSRRQKAMAAVLDKLTGLR
jgi:autotransporter adhesin